jgi:predicted ArsR family transcriptional regulator
MTPADAQERAVYRAVATHGPATALDIAGAAGLGVAQTTERLKRLKAKARVRYNGGWARGAVGMWWVEH